MTYYIRRITALSFNFSPKREIESFKQVKKERNRESQTQGMRKMNNKMKKMQQMENTVEAEENIRKGPWTEQEDLQLVCFVGLFGDRRWDFIAKVSGLNRTGKSCRLRWVNYLHPGLKRGRMTPQEERLVLELHARWGNRWSRIARKLPGRTDNEIKNYWRTHMRKKAQERKRASMTSSSSLSSINSTVIDSPPMKTQVAEGIIGSQDKGSCFGDLAARGEVTEEEGSQGYYSMDQIWKEIADEEEVNSNGLVLHEETKEEGCSYSCLPMASPMWDYYSDSLWRMEEEEIKMLINPMGNDLSVPNFGGSRQS